MRWMDAVVAGGMCLAAATFGTSGHGALAVHAALAATPMVTTAGSPAVGDLGNGILVDRVRIVVPKIELEGEGSPEDGSGSRCGRDGEGGLADAGEHAEGDCEREYAFGPFLVDLRGTDLAGAGPATVWRFTAPVPAGTYDEVEIVIDALPPGRTSDDPGLAGMAALRASLVVDGSVDGAAFQLVAPLAVELEREGRIAVSGSGATVALAVAPSTWFAGSGGTRLDPRSSTARGQILRNVRASFRVLKDDDHDGCDDDHDATPACSRPTGR